MHFISKSKDLFVFYLVVTVSVLRIGHKANILACGWRQLGLPTPGRGFLTSAQRLERQCGVAGRPEVWVTDQVGQDLWTGLWSKECGSTSITGPRSENTSRRMWGSEQAYPAATGGPEPAALVGSLSLAQPSLLGLLSCPDWRPTLCMVPEWPYYTTPWP